MTAHTPLFEERQREVVDALDAIGVPVSYLDGSIQVDGVRLTLSIIDRAHPTPAAIAQIIADAPARRPAIVIADRISEPGRERLRRAGWGWLDRRGHVRLWTNGVRIDSPVPGAGATPDRASGNPWTTVGLEVALATMIEPSRQVSARHIAAVTDRSVGAVHDLIARFSTIGLIGKASRLPLMPELFWEAAAHWPDGDWLGLPQNITALTDIVEPHQIIRVDERAATLGGARIAAAGDMPARAYITNQRGLRRLRGMVDRDAPVRTWVRSAPVHYVPINAEFPADSEYPWTIAHPILCALRLAADPARGREIVEQWGIVQVGAEP